MPLTLDSILTLPPPLQTGISPKVANGLAFAFAASYVGSLYIAPLIPWAGRPLKGTTAEDSASRIPLGHRDHPTTMRMRMRAVSMATRLSLAGVFWTVKTVGNYDVRGALVPTLDLLGLRSSALQMPFAYLLAPTLFLGPLVASWFDGTLPGQAKFGPFHWGLAERRNYLVGPVTEELLFRSCIIGVSILGGLPASWLVFGTPLWFGLAHAHHALQTYRDGGKTHDALLRAGLGCMFQMSYTTLFGWFASYLYIRTGSVLPPIVSHVFCNMMGIYGPGTASRRHPNHKLAISVAYLGGIAGFIWGLTKF
ncbi:uncharacterized protein CcaverHIS019_0302880 [Cutaneotrichosporon cavernicola]|uniref:intramembrane prenyl-peptidase Rce1 n=1 Tax=Cutaneotrichosporon cavernicola TaxID=279322 RepID=A0AA48L2R8_9TREE|nr:uncharacterized protein CcaverHIS019_0302880 [Cutaneotrichosporon cavernicola]BEI90218.1 hypothetical protein CcaverHIS019_0302880 [Cutaneotrichosporon cavernicola]BEJ05773.1 hypothetical protein CcaverHIS641_0302950 [Cutaneotrichosporon cavernicola]